MTIAATVFGVFLIGVAITSAYATIDPAGLPPTSGPAGAEMSVPSAEFDLPTAPALGSANADPKVADNRRRGGLRRQNRGARQLPGTRTIVKPRTPGAAIRSPRDRLSGHPTGRRAHGILSPRDAASGMASGKRD